MSTMFCFQCEQTANHQACTNKVGNCGKSAELANLQDHLVEKVMALALVSKHDSSELIDDTLLTALFMTVTNVNFDPRDIQNYSDKVESMIHAFTNHSTNAITYPTLWWHEKNEDIHSIKSCILFALKGVAAYVYHTKQLGYSTKSISSELKNALITLCQTDNFDELLALLQAVGKTCLDSIALLDQANTACYGSPTPTTISTKIEPGPFIVITGHDLQDLHLLLQQTESLGINIYTHGEMLPAHAYPKMKTFSHLKGHFGTAWQNQQTEFAQLPAPILYTTNCIMPVRKSYDDRVFTTSVVGYPGMHHIGEEKDFTPVIKKSLELGGYAHKTQLPIYQENNTYLTTGFAHQAVLAMADKIIEAISQKKIKHIYLVGGCDGAEKSRSYYTDFVLKTPADSLVLTLGCGKYRFNYLDLGKIDDLPRILDMGQCNDAFSAIQVALALAKHFNCSVNELPLTLVLSWYEQKALTVLLSLLHLDIKNIFIGPTPPAFISPKLLDILVKKWGVRLISNVEDDIAFSLNQSH